MRTTLGVLAVAVGLSCLACRLLLTTMGGGLRRRQPVTVKAW